MSTASTVSTVSTVSAVVSPIGEVQGNCESKHASKGEQLAKRPLNDVQYAVADDHGAGDEPTLGTEAKSFDAFGPPARPTCGPGSYDEALGTIPGSTRLESDAAASRERETTLDSHQTEEQQPRMTTGAQPLSRDELAALGKKKLEEFRQRKLRKALEQQPVGGEVQVEQASNHPSTAASLAPEIPPPEFTAFDPPRSMAGQPLAPVQARSPEAEFAEGEESAALSGGATFETGFFDAGPGSRQDTVTREPPGVVSREPPGVVSLPAASTSVSPEVAKKVSFDARKFMVMVEADARSDTSPSSEIGDPARVDLVEPSLVDGAGTTKEPTSAASETVEATAGETVAETRLGALAVTSSENQESFFLPSRQNNQGSKFKELQDHIDSLTTQNHDLSLCLSQQTTMVQRLTEENEGLVHKLNEASRLAEQSQEREKAQGKERELLGTQWRELERQLARREKENRDLASKVKILGVELLGLEEKLLRERNERLKLSARPVGGDRDASRREVEEMSKVVSREREEKLALQERIRTLETAGQGLIEELAAERARAEAAERATKARAPAYPAPQSAMVSAEPMQAFVEREARGETPPLDDARLPDELRALLPINSWIPSLEEEQKMQQDVVDAIGRLYERIEGLARERNDAITDDVNHSGPDTGTPGTATRSTRPVGAPSPSSIRPQ